MPRVAIKRNASKVYRNVSRHITSSNDAGGPEEASPGLKGREAVRQVGFGDCGGPQGPVNTISDEKSTTTNYPCLRGRTTTEN